MISQNSITLQGNLARDAQPLNSTGKARTRLVIAANYGHGEHHKVDFIDVTVFGTTAENAARYLKKGAVVLIDGHLTQNIYDRGNGQDKVYKLEVIGDRVQFGAKTEPRKGNRAQMALAA